MAQTGCYIHIPFCQQRCTYCDFNTYVGLLSLQDAYVKAINDEIRLQAGRWPGLQVDTLYFGGGTPSLLSVENISRIIRRVRRYFGLPQYAEVTMEANPGTVSYEKLCELRKAGVNRLSFGVQSSHSDELLLLGRIHTWLEAVDAFQMARQAGFENISIDLMYGLPGQSLEAWIETLHHTLELGPDHLSLYALTLEPGTPLAETLALANVNLEDQDIVADMYDSASELLLEYQFWQYEISNWARAESHAPAIWAYPPEGNVESISRFICQHNLIYWRNEAWIGIGAGAHSWFRGKRFSQHPHPKSYINAIRSGRLKGVESEVIPAALAQDETMMLGLRLVEGVSEHRFSERWGVSLFGIYKDIVEKLGNFGFLSVTDHHVRLSPHVRLLGNQIFQEFLR